MNSILSSLILGRVRRDDVHEGGAIALKLGFADPPDVAHRRQARRPGRRHLAKGAVVEDDIGRHPASAASSRPARAERLEQRIVRIFGRAGRPRAGCAARALGGSTISTFSSPLRIARAAGPKESPPKSSARKRVAGEQARGRPA
jgi:hypothetical protein